MSTLTSSLEQEANLHRLGRFLMRMHLRDLLETRLRLAQAWRGNPASLACKSLAKPVFIVGMPRSGSTFLHELLAQNPALRVPRVWEVMFPLQAANGGRRGANAAIRKAKFCLWWFRRLAPRADAVYPMRALTPHECVAIHSYTFFSEEFISTCHVPSYETFLHNSDLAPVYQWEKKFLQHLQSDIEEKRWLLKSPDHVYGLDALFATFPDAMIIQTHRNPLHVLRSSADLTRVLRGLYGPPGDPEEILQREAQVLARGTERFLHFRDSHPELAERFVDVKYADLIAAPVATVRRICEKVDIPFAEATAKGVQQLAAGRARYCGHRARVQRVKRAFETSLFAQYCSRFGLSLEEPGLEG